MDKKRVVIIKKQTVDHLCQICGRMVIVAKAKPWILETEKSIIYTWDYGHQHRRVYDFVKSKQTLLENTVDQDYE